MGRSGRLIAGVVALALAASVAAADLAGVVVKVSDGDTLHLVDDAGDRHVVRLMAIDAPERRQAFGAAARAHLVRMVDGKRVGIEGRRLDRDGRRVGRVIYRRRDVGLALVAAGHAWVSPAFVRQLAPEDRERYASAEAAARAARIGLWRAADPVPPWAWRAP